MMTVSVLIDCSVEEVWRYLTTPKNWYDWYCEDSSSRAQGMEAVRPDWEKGAEIVWSSIGSKPSRITKAVPCKELAFDAGWEGVVTFKLKAQGQSQAQLEIRKKESSNAFGQKDSYQKMLQQFKVRVEKERAAV